MVRYIGAALIILCCSAGNVFGQSLRIEIEEILSVGGLEQETLYQWAGVCTDNSGNIYITDIMDYAVKKFDSSGTLIKRTGRMGSGPGEFMQIRGIITDGEQLFILDQMNPGIQVFDTDLRFTGRIPYSLPIKDMELADTVLMIEPIALSGGLKLVSIDSAGQELSVITCPETGSDPFMNSADFKPGKNGSFYLAFLFQDRIVKIDSTGCLLWEHARFKGKKQDFSRVDDVPVPLPDKTFYKAIALDSHDYVFVLGGSYSLNKSRDIYVYSHDGRFLTEFTLSAPTHDIYIDGADCLYARADEGVTLKKYRLKYSYTQ